jgi:hypothetical protein
MGSVNEVEFFKCPDGHMCYRAFGMPYCYSEACLMSGEINCSICENKGIDEQRFMAYFTYCEECLETEGDSTGANYSVCMTCTSRWRDGIDIHDLAHHSLTAEAYSGNTMVDVQLDSDSDSDASDHNERKPQTLDRNVRKGMRNIRASIVGSFPNRSPTSRPKHFADEFGELDL